MSDLWIGLELNKKYLKYFNHCRTWVIYLWVELTAAGNIIVVPFPVFEEGKDRVEKKEENHAEYDDLLETDSELWGGHSEGGKLGGGAVVITIVTVVTTAGAVALGTLGHGHCSFLKFVF